ncbi:hypothetical protein SSBR45G_57620 [Bradyrhizobium sp. SSBR45G]|uniref:hypothetical protein n=1 Tax=unclassified Bradyrhizobium TaxID=2631580 RepID=UPI002342B380|nr:MULTISPECIES: hypothetical protein [unclassified Bradyrhizobium]GLH80853.1 hypothetical protein SSBR45G_57620 [Bradyrhizobium sp. SSBR45G]GLH88325.1 hypothetical protein SSBR45R_57860 [Bradyrhizobium sp. SSBR45R]
MVDVEPADADRVSEEVADAFSDSLLMAASISERHIDFVCRLLADPLLTGRRGLFHLINGLYVEREKLSDRQVQRLLACMVANFERAADEDPAFAIGDFVARVAPPDRALALLGEMTVKAGARDAVSGIFLGLDILLKQHKENAEFLAAVDAALMAVTRRAAELEIGDDAPALRLVRQIECAFAHREKPEVLINRPVPVADDEDALWFAGRDWREITPRDWRDHSDAFFRFTPDAFRYYLQSILCLVAKNPDETLLVADALIDCLDRTPNPEWWDQFLLDRLCGLQMDEYDAISAWIAMLSESSKLYDGDSLLRAYQTIHLMHADAEKEWLEQLRRR